MLLSERIQKTTLKANDYIAIVFVVISIFGFRFAYINFVLVALLGLWLLAGMIQGEYCLHFLKNKVLLPLSAFFLYSLFGALLSGNYLAALKVNLGMLANLSGIYLFYYYLYYKKFYAMALIAGASFGAMLLASAVSTYLFSGNVDLPILLVQGGDQYAYAPLGEVYGLSYANCLLACFLLSLAKYKRAIPSYRSLFLYLLFLFQMYAIYKSRTSLTFMASLLGAAFTLFFANIKTAQNISKAKFSIALLGIVLLLFLVIYNGSLIGDALMNLGSSKQSKLLQRLYELGEFLSGVNKQQVLSNDSERLTRMIASINVWLRYPLFGVNHIVGGDHFALQRIGIGLHSQLFDYLAQYGIVGCLLLFSVHFVHLRSIVRLSKSLSYVWVFLILLLNIINPYKDFTVLYVQFFLIPSLYFLTGDIDYESFCNTVRISK